MKEKKFNIIPLLKSCKNKRLSSPMIGACTFKEISPDGYITVTNKEGEEWDFIEDGTFNEHGQVMLYPDTTMHDWHFFESPYVICSESIHGDALIDLFKSVNGEPISYYDYTQLGAIYYLDRETNHIEVLSKDNYPEQFEYLLANGIDLLEQQSQYLIGDMINNDMGSTFLIVADNAPVEEFFIKVSDINANSCKMRMATAEEKDKLVQELHKANYHYDCNEDKLIHWFNTKDEVMVRKVFEEWTYAIFSHYNKESIWPYVVSGGSSFCHCIPYNEETKHLIGTKEEYTYE